MSDNSTVAAADEQHDPGPLRVRVFVAFLTVIVGLGAWRLERVGARLSVSAVVVVLGGYVLAELYDVDIEFRRDVHSIAFSSVPTIVGLAVLPPTVVLALRLTASVAVLAAYRRQPAFKLMVNLCSHTLGVIVAATWFDTLGRPGHPAGVVGWFVIAGAVVAADIAEALVVNGAIGLFVGSFAGLFSEIAWVTLAAKAVDIVFAVVVVTLLRHGESAAWLMAVLGVVYVIVLRAYARVAGRYRHLELLGGYTRRIGAAVLDGSVVPTLLTETAEVLHAERSWLVVTRDGTRVRLDCSDRVECESVATPLDLALDRSLRDQARRFDLDSDLGPDLGDDGVREVVVARLSVRGIHGESVLLAVADRSGTLRPFDREDEILLDTLARHAEVVLENVALVDDLRGEAAANEYLATHDPLTDLPNRVAFELTIAAERRSRLGVMVLGLDRFMEVNDTLGHHHGDELLRAVAQRLTAATPEGALLARLGGDEFAVLWRGLDGDEVLDRSRTLLGVITAAYPLAGLLIDVSATAGVAVDDGLGDDRDLLRHADVALNLAKSGRTGIERYTADRDPYSAGRLALVGRLRQAIQQGELAMFFQPQIDLLSERLTGVEALVRWFPPGRDQVYPDEFIGVAEHTGLIKPLTRDVLARSITQAARWRRSGDDLRISVNLSARNLVEDDLVDHIAELLRREDLPAHLLEVEITETAVMADPERSVAAMHALRRAGIQIAIDDFGTGHSSLAYLTSLPVDRLKIDKSFVLAMSTDPAAEIVVRTIISLGHDLGLDIVAEGVETAANVETLRSLGCTIAQGYFYGRPMAPEQLDQWRIGHQRGRRAASPAAVAESASPASVRPESVGN